MRGCLSVVFLALVFAGVAVWFGGPPLASAIVQTTLTTSGFTADTLAVDVTSDPPLTLAAGRADRVSVSATGVSWNGLEMATLTLNLGSVDLIARTAATADGRLGGVRIGGTASQPIVADVELSGRADAARTTITVGAAAVTAAALAAFQAAFGVRPSSVSLVEPDLVRVKVGALTISAKLAITEDGAVVAIATGKTVRILEPDPSVPLHLTGLAVAGDGLVLDGTFDVGELLR